MSRLRIPRSLREHCGGLSEVEVAATDVVAALVELEQRYPGCRERLLTADGRLREFVQVFVNDQQVDATRHRRLRSSDLVSILPAVSGG